MVTICTASIRRMHSLWNEMFDTEICIDYTQRLPDHLVAFFDEVYEESYARKERILEQISQLRQEAEDLRRLLGDTTDYLVAGVENMPLLRQQMTLDRSLEQMRAKLQERHEIIDQYILEAETLCEELGETPRTLSKNPMPTQEELISFRSYLDHLIAEKMQRLDEIDSLRREIKKLMGQLETIPMNDEQEQLLNARNFPPTCENMTQLRLLREETVSQYDSLRQHIDDTRTKLERLWKCLETPAAVVKKFHKLTAYTQTTFDKLFAELDRCETLRRENLKLFIERTRLEIVEWWDRCMKSEEARTRFSSFQSDVYSEDVLRLHELELIELKDFYRKNEQLFEMVTQRQEMWDRMLALENKSNDPSRYNNRGGKLLEEEKERRRISNQLPKIEAKLLEACQRYEEENDGCKFIVFGKSVEELIADQWKQREQSKQQISSARKQANGLLGMSTVGRTPGRGESTIKSTTMMTGSNRTRLGVGGPGSALKAMTPIHGAASATKSATWMKRKLATPTNSIHAKRSLLRELNSPALSTAGNRTGSRLLIPKAAPGKIPTIKVYDSKVAGSTAQKRRSRRKSQTSKQRRSVSMCKPPSVTVSSADGTLLQESVCYEKIENFFDNNVPNRSSVVADKLTGTRMTRSQRNRLEVELLNSFVEGEENMEPPATVVAAAPGTPSAHHAGGGAFHHGISTNFSHVPAASSTMLRSPGVGPHSTSIASSTRNGQRRLKPAKNCPIIF
ncbi:hypothetical protein ZHAS_00015561 [Anopheles sinensis]|uniref:Protein regulator of cytokinesis 1 prc1 n=1 Tax=Anopheles sinensis TaxID=74873 RepID=A0A084WBJ8_ANOSI|nr:hypothetical protein ZHAS_00015561 [Anopheles sinensis]